MSKENEPLTQEETAAEEAEQMFDDVLAGNESYKEELDNRIQTALQDAEKQWKKEYQSKLETEKTEAERLASMTKEEKEKYALEKRENDLQEREAKIARQELKAEAKTTLADKGLPSALAEVLNYDNAESCNASIETVAKVFESAVQEAVEEKIKGGKPPKSPPEQSNDFESRLAQARKDGNNISDIQIKQEAAAKGIILI